jgi:hypothetical protein
VIAFAPDGLPANRLQSCMRPSQGYWRGSNRVYVGLAEHPSGASKIMQNGDLGRLLVLEHVLAHFVAAWFSGDRNGNHSTCLSLFEEGDQGLEQN